MSPSDLTLRQFAALLNLGIRTYTLFWVLAGLSGEHDMRAKAIIFGQHLALILAVFGGLVLAACSHSPSVKQGQLLYRENGCASCHGISGRGDGPAAATLPAKPTDLNHPDMFKRGSAEVAIARTLADGITGAETSIPALHHSHHEFVMPKFDHLTELERRSIALYILSLRGG